MAEVIKENGSHSYFINNLLSRFTVLLLNLLRFTVYGYRQPLLFWQCSSALVLTDFHCTALIT